MTVTLVLGGARSGKSRLAESLAQGERHYIATAQAFDEEMRLRIAAHVAQRGNGWTTHDAPFDLAEVLQSADRAGRFILVDCLTLWLSNLMLTERDIDAATVQLLAIIAKVKADVVFVSNEVGLSIVPDTPLGRRFRDAQGILNQRIAAVADCVVFVAAGLPLVLKGALPNLPKAPA